MEKRDYCYMVRHIAIGMYLGMPWVVFIESNGSLEGEGSAGTEWFILNDSQTRVIF